MDSQAIDSFAAPGRTAKVSVIIPCYRQSHLLADAIKSVLQQTHKHYEVLVVDDGSPDNVVEVAMCYPNIRIVRQRNQGLAAARNSGFRHSNGEFLVFLDADDRLTPECLSIGLEEFTAHPDCAMISGHWRYIRMDGAREDDFAQRPLEGEPYLTLLERNYVGMNAAVMIRRGAFEAVGGFDISLASCEDYELYMRLARAYPVFSHGMIVAEYRRYDQSMTKQPCVMMQGLLGVFAAQLPLIRGNAAYLKAFRRGLYLNSKVAYWPALGAAKRALKRGNLMAALLRARTIARRPMLLLRAYSLAKQAGRELRRCRDASA